MVFMYFSGFGVFSVFDVLKVLKVLKVCDFLSWGKCLLERVKNRTWPMVKRRFSAEVMGHVPVSGGGGKGVNI